MKTEYVLCFMFNYDFSKVAMIRKRKPEWQAGLLNGIGGKVESGESPRDAMIREFEEETGYEIDNMGLKSFCLMEGEDFKVFTFTCRGHLELLRTMEAEPIVIVDVANLPKEQTVENIMWLVHMAIDTLQDGRPHAAHVAYDRSVSEKRNGMQAELERAYRRIKHLEEHNSEMSDKLNPGNWGS